MKFSIALLFTLSLLSSGTATLVSDGVTAANIEWATDFEAALETAGSEDRVVFIAVNMDGEAANDRMAEDVYGDRDITALAARTINLVASNDAHRKSGKCPRFGCESCEAHREVDVRVRDKVLEPDASGAVIAPQHVFLGPDGAVLLSVPYEVTALELCWCFGEAFRLAGVDDPPKVPSKARAPRRLVVGDVATVGRSNPVPLTKEEVEELIAEIKKGGARDNLRSMIRDLATADEPEAIAYIQTALRSSNPSGAGGRGGRGGGRRDGGDRERGELLRWIGTASPPSYHEVVGAFIGSGTEATRAEAIVALEQLGSPDSLKRIQGALKKIKDDRLEKNLLRALGAAGSDDAKAEKTLLKASEDRRRPLVRQNALIALGWFATSDSVETRLRAAARPDEFGGGSKIKPSEVGVLEQEAAVVAMGISRDERWKELLTAMKDDESLPEELRDTAERAISVIDGEPYGRLREALMRAGEDTIPRDRHFPEVRERRRR